jgi:hypothetical protein
VVALRTCGRWLEASAGARAKLKLGLALAPIAIATFALGRGAYAYAMKLHYDRAHAEALRDAPPSDTVATDLWWLPPEIQASVPQPRYYLTAYVPGSSQLRTPQPNPDATIRTAFLDELDTTGSKSFTFVGTRGGLDTIRELASHRSRVFVETSERPAAELFIGQFSTVDSVSKK